MEGFATNLVLRSRRGPSVSFNATAAPDCIVKAVTTALVEDHELPALLKNEVSLISTRETPDILLGQDTFQLFRRGKPKRLPNGFDMIRTLLGPVIGGAGRVANPSKADSTIAFVVTGIEDLPDAPVVSVRFPPPPPASKFSTMPFPPSNSKSDRQAQTTLGPLPESCLDALDDRQAQTALGPCRSLVPTRPTKFRSLATLADWSTTPMLRSSATFPTSRMPASVPVR